MFLRRCPLHGLSLFIRTSKMFRNWRYYRCGVEGCTIMLPRKDNE